MQQREREREIQREREKELERRISHAGVTDGVTGSGRVDESQRDTKLELKLRELQDKGLVRLERTASGSLDIEVVSVTSVQSFRAPAAYTGKRSNDVKRSNVSNVFAISSTSIHMQEGSSYVDQLCA